MSNFDKVLQDARDKAFRGGLAGAAAMTVQVSSLMWIRTCMNYQYRYGSGMADAFKTIYMQGTKKPILGSQLLGGLRRFYRGFIPALVQGPASRFGDTASNAGMLALLESSPKTKELPMSMKTILASLTASGFRVLLMPIDAVKTSLQVDGGLGTLRNRVRSSGFTAVFHGSMGAAGATFVGHYPWFATYNYLSDKIPVPEDRLHKLGRNALIGFCASLVSDTTSNSIRVLKTYRQTASTKISYADAAKSIIKSEGVVGLLGRGLKVRLIANGLQGMLFSVLWKHFESIL